MRNLWERKTEKEIGRQRKTKEGRGRQRKREVGRGKVRKSEDWKGRTIDKDGQEKASDQVDIFAASMCTKSPSNLPPTPNFWDFPLRPATSNLGKRKRY